MEERRKRGRKEKKRGSEGVRGEGRKKGRNGGREGRKERH